MVNTIICPHCGQSIEITEALTHELKNEISTSLKEEYAKKLEEVKGKAEEIALKKITEEMNLKIKDKENEAEEIKKRNEKLQEDILEMSKMMRELKEKDNQREVEMQKKLAAEEEKIRFETQKKVEEENQSKLLQKDKQLQDTLKELEDARRKLQQGSQQTQGEAFELEFEDLLKRQYPNDKILPVGKGIKGGDIIQEVWDSRGNFTGKILWELKNAKAWSEGWVDKLKDDKRSINAEEAVLVSEIMPSEMKNAGFRNSIWVTQRSFFIPLADSLRTKLIQLYYVKSSVQGKDEKMEILYQYLSGTEFKHRVEAIIDAFSNMQQEVEKEKRYFSNKWARDEKNIRHVIDNTYGMHGDLKGIIGKVLPEIKGFEAPELESGEK
ncbi:DUF2130 domain-containing protein [Candidatus Parcubacteria bacterium]|nr:MAG: DUF2130 domain-containing protein [Candidatus Parcubacteria bacterium]